VIRCLEREVAIDIRYFDAHAYWNYALADYYYQGAFDHDSFYPPGFPGSYRYAQSRTGPAGYYYGCAFIARPEYWNPRFRVGAVQWRPTLLSEVSYPSKKCLFWAWYPIQLDLPDPLWQLAELGAFHTEVGMTDGSAQNIRITPATVVLTIDDHAA